MTDLVSAATPARPRREIEPRLDVHWVVACGVPDEPSALATSERESDVVVSRSDGQMLRVIGLPGAARRASAGSLPCGVVFDGVIHNAEELRAELGPWSARAADDSALVLQAYLRWGDDVVRKIKGIYALVIWDGRSAVILAARDRMGLYPLFHARAGREVLFSTSGDALVRHPRVSRSLNLPLLADSLCNRWHDIEETHFSSVRRVPQGHLLRMSSGVGRDEWRTARYWNPKPSSEHVAWITSDHVERFNEALDQAVSRVLALGPAGIFLSGGLDSVSVAAVTAENARTRGMPAPWGLSLAFPHPECNEEPVQRGVAAALGLPHLVLPFEEAIGGESVMMAALELCRSYPAPLMSIWQPAYLRLAGEGKQRGCRNILTGGGGDEWLSVSPLLAADLLRTLDVRGVYRLYRNMARSHPLRRRALLRNILWKFGARPVLTGAGAKVLRAVAPGVLQANRRRYIARTTPAYLAPDPALRRTMDRRADQHLPEPRLEHSYYWQEGQQALVHPIVSAELEEVFENGRRLGMRQFPTYLDADLVDILMRTPPHVLNRGGRSKGLVRDAMARRFPGHGFERQKKVTAYNYYRSLIRRETRYAWNAVGGTPTLAGLGIVDAGRLEPAVQRILSDDRTRDGWAVWSLLSLEVWARARV